MLHHVYSTEKTYPLALLIKTAAYNLTEVEKTYIEPLEYQGISRRKIIVIALPYEEGNKASQAFIKESLANILKGLVAVGTQTIYCADASYFKVLTKERKAEMHLGYKMECKFPEYEDAGFDVVLGLNHKSIMHNPANDVKLAMSITALHTVHLGTFDNFTTPILKNALYPTGKDIRVELGKLFDEPILFIDIEGFSLDFDKAKIATIAFSKNQSDGIAFACDWEKDNPDMRHHLRFFFENYRGYKVFHNAAYDIKSLILNIWMEGRLMDRAGMLNGLDVMCDKMHDTRLIAYLATNTTAGNKLGLKDLSHEYVGNYAIDVKDITQHDLKTVLEYNLTDCCATSYVFDKYWPLLESSNQVDVYNTLFLPSLKTIIQTEMVGMPLNSNAVTRAKDKLTNIAANHYAFIKNSPITLELNELLQKQEMLKDNARLKQKQHSIERYSDIDSEYYVEFNPGSSLQLQLLLYTHMALPIKELTPKKLPSTKNNHVEALKQYTDDQQQLDLINAITGWSEVQKILNTFITAFERALNKGDEDIIWLHGSFMLGGTKSGRLSSSRPNLQNLPSGKTYGKLIKSCFQAPKGWIFGGADFSSLEDRISALQTKDPNKLKVYQDGYDGHSLRAFSYFPERLPGIENTVESINSIEQKFPQVRQDSKGPTFLLTYGGTAIGLKKTLGFPTKEAVQIEQNYHKLYEVSDQWVQDELNKAAQTGYVELAFGMRLKTPLLEQTLRNRKGMLPEAKNEERTAGNALGQSYGLLNNRALNAFMQIVWDSPYRYDILPISMIHDAIYLIWRDDLAVTMFVNKHLIQEMKWQDLDTIKHPDVTLEAELCLYHPTWADEIKLPNACDSNFIINACTNQIVAA